MSVMLEIPDNSWSYGGLPSERRYTPEQVREFVSLPPGAVPVEINWPPRVWEMRTMCIDFVDGPADEHWSMPEFGPLTTEEVRDGILSVMASMTTACEKAGLPAPQFSMSAEWAGKIFGTP